MIIDIIQNLLFRVTGLFAAVWAGEEACAALVSAEPAAALHTFYFDVTLIYKSGLALFYVRPNVYRLQTYFKNLYRGR